MTQSSYYGGDFDSFTRSSHRAPTAAHYDRPVPYTHGYYEAPDYPGRAGSRALLQEQGQDNQPTAHARRRIQVAVSLHTLSSCTHFKADMKQCSRCRRRKIKCTGDPGDGSGCSACRSAGADRNTCTFNRVSILTCRRGRGLTAVRWAAIPCRWLASISCLRTAAWQQAHL